MSETGNSNSHIDFLERITALYRDPPRPDILESYSSISYRVTSYLAGMEAMLSAKTGEKLHADWARRYLLVLCSDEGLPGGVVGEFGLHAAALGYSCIRTAECLTAEDHSVIRGHLIRSAVAAADRRVVMPDPPRPRVTNHATFAMAGCAMVAGLFPESQGAARLNAFSDEIWNDWWAIRETPEVSTHYEPFTLTSLVRAAEISGREELFFSDPKVRASFERNLQHLSPLGVMPTYGDGSWATSWSWWTAGFAKAAAFYGDGRFSWAAHRLLDYAYEQRFWSNAHNSADYPDAPVSLRHLIDADVLLASYGLVLAELWDDPGVEDAVPATGSGVTYRYLPAPGLPFRTGEKAEEKLILRSGLQKDDIYMAVSLLKKMWHDQYDAGAILQLASNGSMLLSETGAEWKAPVFHNCFFVRPSSEDFLDPQETASAESFASIEYLCDSERASLAALSSDSHQGYPVDHRRVITMGKQSRVVGIWDTAAVSGDLEKVLEFRGTSWGRHGAKIQDQTADRTANHTAFRIGPIFHTQNIISHGAGYFDTGCDSMRSSDGCRFGNKPYSLLISFPLRNHSTGSGTPNLPDDYWSDFALDRTFIQVFEEGRTQRECVYQNSDLEVGESSSFLSLLLPHSTDLAGNDIAKDVEVIASDDVSCCVRIGGMILLFNDGGTVSNDVIETDARQLYIEESEKGVFVAYRAASTIVFRGRELLGTGEAGDGELSCQET